ncbi:MAG: CRISPR system precrRNA processing endoribonuclease RAMP protein Cas6 [Candidatus Cloacimonadota bacterium]
MLFLEFKVHYIPNQSMPIISDLSSAIRGLWGRGLRSVYCFQKQSECSNCALDNCTYYVLFEKKLSDSDQYHPYIIQAQVVNPFLIEAKFRFFGWICEHSEKLIYSLLQTDGKILHRNGQAYQLSLCKILDCRDASLYSKGNPNINRPHLASLKFVPREVPGLRIDFLSPLRQKHEGRLMSEFEWMPFAKSLINRIRFINTHFNRDELTIPDNIELDGVKIVSSHTYWSEKIRVSHRQDARMSIGGLVGYVVVKDVSPEMVGILKLARYLHAGKQCSFGNGEIGLRILSETDPHPG